MSRTNALVRRLSRHLGWKISALLLAVVLWLFIEGAPQLVTMQTVPILYRNLADGLVLSADTPGTVRAELRGSSVRLSLAALSQVSVAVDLSDVKGPEERTFNLASSNVSVPQGISFLRSVPSQIRLAVDRVAVKAVPVKVRLKGTPPPGYKIETQQVFPDTLRIVGPEGRVSRIEFAETDATDVSAITETTERRVNSFIPDERVQFESDSAVTVTLTVKRIETR
jgi:YbbR domain-containing protein